MVRRRRLTAAVERQRVGRGREPDDQCLHDHQVLGVEDLAPRTVERRQPQEAEREQRTGDAVAPAERVRDAEQWHRDGEHGPGGERRRVEPSDHADPAEADRRPVEMRGQARERPADRVGADEDAEDGEASGRRGSQPPVRDRRRANRDGGRHGEGSHTAYT
jgi:hypothetical protein